MLKLHLGCTSQLQLDHLITTMHILMNKLKYKKAALLTGRSVVGQRAPFRAKSGVWENNIFHPECAVMTELKTLFSRQNSFPYQSSKQGNFWG